MDGKIKSKIGMTWSGVQVVIPHVRDYWELKAFLSMFKVEEQVDIFCMSEHMIELLTNKNIESSLTKTLQILASMFDIFIGDAEFRRTLETFGLTESKARRAIGKLLVDTEFKT